MADLLKIFKKNSLVKRLDRIKMGDKQEREKIIEEYIPFIMKTVSTVTNKYIESENSEEYSVGLEAFNEAINKYDSKSGNFISFAKIVISSRTKDYLRKTKKESKVISINQFPKEEQENIYNNLNTEDFVDKVILKEEIKTFEKKLNGFDITFNDLLNEAPKHKDTRINAISIARYIFENDSIKTELMTKKRIPNSKIINELNVTQKILKRSRKFIIAAVLILEGDSDLLKSYITLDKEGVKI
ncbi:RNA polymerase sigma-I factor [Tepidibacter aestuarii]|uniref:RNA polymerase sigma-I factor n=1 Tax=Tepidibacter aestuarii TaxID=2925782 RepID=UPI0020BD98F4|nr:RNA polymerase sigma-I factor [Tepidibacter aestuarii]CAH2215292.1 RNA polymerase sigma factor SigI [Tepidibacter aestuarii]